MPPQDGHEVPLTAGKHLEEVEEATGCRAGAWNLTLRTGHSVESKAREHFDSLVVILLCLCFWVMMVSFPAALLDPGGRSAGHSPVCLAGVEVRGQGRHPAGTGPGWGAQHLFRFVGAGGGVLRRLWLSVGQVNYPKVADSSSFDEDSSDALSPEQPASHESQGSVPSPLEARVSEPLPSATSVSPTQVSLPHRMLCPLPKGPRLAGAAQSEVSPGPGGMGKPGVLHWLTPDLAA